MATLTGVIERITYHNEENGYTVARLNPEGGGALVTVVGKMIGVHVGEAVELHGEWVRHSQYGRQFKVEEMRLRVPTTVRGIEKYLGSGLIKGIGPVTAARIVSHFGRDTLRIIAEEPERLSEVPGVGRKRIAIIKKAWKAQEHLKEVMIFLQSHGVSTALAVKIYKTYGNSAIQVLRTNPYRLQQDVYGIGFLTADKIARALGLRHDSPDRIAAGIGHVLTQATEAGHVYLPYERLVQEAARLLDVEAAQVEAVLGRLQAEEEVVMEQVMPETEEASEPIMAVYLPVLYYSEVGVAERLRRLQDARLSTGVSRLTIFENYAWHEALARLQSEMTVELAAAQRQAVRTALTHPVTVLTGGPGTGKTTTLRAIIHLLERAGLRYALAAPTGRAAKRMAEATGRPAKTIHRLLEMQPQEGFSFRYNAEHPLKIDMLIVDEASMLDLMLAHHLLRAIPPGAHLLLVGDVDQLPSVGPGNVLRDIIDSGEVATVSLQTIFRQAADSLIITNAHRVNRGEMPLFPKEARDFFLFHIQDVDRCADMVVELVSRRIPEKFGIPPTDIQVLSPMHRGPIGVTALNLRLQEVLNPYSPDKSQREARGRVFRVGDRVMQIRNNYDLEVFNGDMGVVTAVDVTMQTLTVDVDGYPVKYDWINLDELVHAWAVSVHKSQGSEYRAVVLPWHTTHYMMLQRNLLYTAITRARELVVIVGTRKALGIALRNAGVARRYTALAQRCRRAMPAAAGD
ncbi:MAG: ATP-dependent RecD-like DNA helicase [Caldilineae bacterium]|nr:MAG: ATP-dependent RecD-like DNA helicase [Caldilineae bacterium]